MKRPFDLDEEIFQKFLERYRTASPGDKKLIVNEVIDYIHDWLYGFAETYLAKKGVISNDKISVSSLKQSASLKMLSELRGQKELTDFDYLGQFLKTLQKMVHSAFVDRTDKTNREKSLTEHEDKNFDIPDHPHEGRHEMVQDIMIRLNQVLHKDYTDRQIELLEMYFLKNMTYQEIIDELNIINEKSGKNISPQGLGKQIDRLIERIYNNPELKQYRLPKDELGRGKQPKHVQ